MNETFLAISAGALRRYLADPADRIAAIHRSSTLAKGRLTKLPKPVAKNYPALFLTPFAAANVLRFGGHVPPPFNLMISNIPGAIEPQHWAGAALEVIYPIGPVYRGSRMFIASFSGSSTFGVAINADRSSIPQLQRLADYMSDALDELELAVL